MIIGNSIFEYVGIRFLVFFLHYFDLLLVLSLVYVLMLGGSNHVLAAILQVLAITETAFYILIYVPRARYLQKPAIHPPGLSKAERSRLFEKCLQTARDPEHYLSGWSKGAPRTEIKRENVKDFLAWAFFNKGAWSEEEDREMNGFVTRLEEALGRKIEPGRGSASALRLTLDPVNINHRPFILYAAIALLDGLTCIRLMLKGFEFYRTSLSRFLTVFPLRFHTLLIKKESPSRTLSYFHKPHTSRTRKPVLFFHGIGIGLSPYVDFLNAINESTSTDTTDGQVGIIAIEIMPISSRITSEMPSSDELVRDIVAILDKHRWRECVVASHSYGSVVATQMLRHREGKRRIASMLFSDPVTFMLHLPDVAYNFTRRIPRKASEHELAYFASTDMGVSHTLSRHFFWTDNILWKEDLKGKNVTVQLAGKDLIVNAEEVGRYLAADENVENDGSAPSSRNGSGFERFEFTDDPDLDATLLSTTSGGRTDDPATPSDSWKSKSWTGEGLEVLWFPNLDHAQIYNWGRYKPLVTIIKAYCSET